MNPLSKVLKKDPHGKSKNKKKFGCFWNEIKDPDVKPVNLNRTWTVFERGRLELDLNGTQKGLELNLNDLKLDLNGQEIILILLKSLIPKTP